MDNYLDDKLYQQWGKRTGDGPCPRGIPMGINSYSGLPTLTPCGRQSCLPCMRAEVRRLERAACYTEPTGFLTFTSLTWDHLENRARINRLGKYLRRRGIWTYWIWASEINPSGEGVHAHALSRGAVPPIAALQETASQVLLGECHVQPITHHGRLTYLCKMATWNEDSLNAYRNVNGSELVHGRKFWQDPHTLETLPKREAGTRKWARDNPIEARRYGR